MGMRMAAGRAGNFRRNSDGNVAIMTALILPVLLLAMLGGTTAMKAMSERRALQHLAQTVCNRAVKPQRLVVMNDADRKKHAEELFDAIASERGYSIASRTVSASWLYAQVTTTADIKAVPGLGQQGTIRVSVTEECTGIPPYPALGDVVLSSNFKTPTGTSIALTYTNGSRTSQKWGLFTASALGWDGQTGWGVEIQDWTTGFNPDASGVTSYLPTGWSNPYVVELDSGPPLGACCPPTSRPAVWLASGATTARSTRTSSCTRAPTASR